MSLIPPNFVSPPTDGSITPALAIDFHLKHNPHHTFAVLYHTSNCSQITISYEQLACAVHRVAHILNPGNAIPQGTNVGLLVSVSSLEYIIMVLGAMRAGLVPFPISPRVHPSGIAHLLSTTETSLIVAGGSDAIDSTTAQLSKILLECNFGVTFIELTNVRDIMARTETSEDQLFPPPEPIGTSSIVTILHSSGSTGTPKAIKYHFEGVIKNIVKHPHGWAPSELVGTMTLPTFHCLGMVIQVLEPLYTGYTQVLFASARPGVPVVPNPNSTLEAVTSTKCTLLVCVPAFLEAWAQSEDAIALLKNLKGIMFGGGPLTDVIGDGLVDRGLKIYSGYGGTEFGAVHAAPPHNDSKDWPWNYFKFSSHVKTRFIPQNGQDNVFELVFERGEDHCPFVLNSELTGKAIYKTRDLLAPHPSKSGFWRFIGRVDDQIVLLNGEKINPGPVESKIVKCPIVQCAILFGQARNQVGILVGLKEPLESLADISNKRKILIETLWPYMQSANQASATYSRLDKRAIIFVDPSRPLPCTPKGTILRSAALKLYAPDIEELFEALEQDLVQDTSDNVQPPETWFDPNAVSVWISDRVKYILSRDVDTTLDLFQQGMDSLTATMLLRSLKAALHASQDHSVRACELSQTVIFDNPTVRQLASFVVQRILAIGAGESNNRTQKALETMYDTIQKYGSHWPHLSTDQFLQRSDKIRERIVVTGTTGALGSHLLAQLLANDRVERVWALNRKSSENTADRQRVSFEDKMLDVTLLNSHKLAFVDAILDDAILGLNHDMYDEIRSTATIIIHNAWQVNFNPGLQSFEPNIRGTRNLIDLAFSSTAPTGLPRFAFASSISVAGFGVGRELEEVSVRPEDAVSTTGYGQSKLVAEKLLESARQAGLQTCIVRLGQLTGDIKSGSWNTTEWVPSIIASSISVGCLPAAVGTVSWLPLDIAACSIIDMCTADDEQIPPVIHASHPRPVPWADVMSAFSAVLASRTGSALPIVELGEWNKRVVESAAAFQGPDVDRHKRFPSTKIQSTMDRMAHADHLLRLQGGDEVAESGGAVRLVTTRAEQESEGLRSTPRLGREHVERWVKYWEVKALF